MSKTDLAHEKEFLKSLLSDCPLCGGTGKVVNRPSRLMGATYLDGDSGDERLEPCPICCIEEVPEIV